MKYIIGITLAIIIYFIYYKFIKKIELNNIPPNTKLPYKITDAFLTPPEQSFYLALKLYVADKAVICPKVGLKDIFFIGKGLGKDYTKYFNKISKKHVDFLLCEPNTMKPLCGIELDDASHTSKKSYERDLFVEKVYQDASFPLLRFSSKNGYTFSQFDDALSDIFNKNQTFQGENENNCVENYCAKCGIPMILRKALKGENSGKEFLGCTNYPKCKEIIKMN